MLHCAREASRVDEAVAFALGKTSEHAKDSLTTLRDLAKARGVTPSVGEAVGRALSELRDKIADRMLASQTSYRGTLLGMRHGYDIFVLAREAAVREHDAEFAAFAGWWLDTRGPLIEDVARSLSWFAEHPVRALRRATSAQPVHA